jgi:L-lactate utilization protein LutB
MDTERIIKLKENFKKRNIEVKCFEGFDDVLSYILQKVPIDATVGIGHSDTLQRMGMTNAFIKRGNMVYDKELAATNEDNKIIKKKALTADWYITGSNAVSVDGRIINVDHSGNRVASMTFGPDKVLIVIGKNKIEDSLEEAIKRVKNVAAPLNAKRAGYNPPCVQLNKCVDCVSKERVCNYLSIIEGQSDYNRMQLLIVDVDCGF